MKPAIQQNKVHGRAVQLCTDMLSIQIAFQSELLPRRIVESELGCRLEWRMRAILPSLFRIIQFHELNNLLSAVDLHPVEAAIAISGLNRHAEIRWFTTFEDIGEVEDHTLPADFRRQWRSEFAVDAKLVHFPDAVKWHALGGCAIRWPR
jgi:hypothetical protein